jgi:hypothetical protein
MDPRVNDALLLCSQSSWIPFFSRHALKSVTILLPSGFLNYLQEDGVFMDPPDADGEEGWSDEEGEEGEEAAMRPLPWTTRFPELEGLINEAIRSIEGSSSRGAVPKLNWSCPTDALWVNPTASLSCCNAAEVVMMLKSSDRIMHDVEVLMQLEELPAELVLRKYQQGMRPEREFRAFIKRKRLLGVSQRDISQRFPQLSSQRDHGESELDLIRLTIQRFYDQVLISSLFPLQDYSIDLYITTEQEVKVLDINPICEGAVTSSLLFQWSELGPNQEEASEVAAESGSAEWELRIVTEAGLKAGQRMACQMPIDMTSLDPAADGCMISTDQL